MQVTRTFSQRGRKTKTLQSNPTRKVLLSSWYEVADENTALRTPGCNTVASIEANFGTLHTDLARKLAFDDLQTHISSYGF